MTHDELVKLTSEARDNAWRGWGELSPEVITHLISPMFMGGPVWPNTRQAFRVARSGGETLVASDGLADPFDHPNTGSNGLGLEFYGITGDALEQVPGSWLFDVVWQMSQFAAGHGQLAELLDELELLTTELYDVGIPPSHAERFVAESGRVGVILGMTGETPPARVDGPLSPIRLVNIKLLTLAELEYVATGGDGARAGLARRLAAQGTPLVSGLDRPTVI